MGAITLTRPALFIATHEVVAVDDEQGRPFYYRAMRRGKTFRLPVGTWNVNGARFARHLKGKVAFPDGADLPDNFVIEYGLNPNKASVWPEQGRMLLDSSLMEESYATRTFILLHEVGHYYHDTEEECDRFAARMMRNFGFNPSQISEATRSALSHHSARRHTLNHKYARRMDRRA